MLPPNLEGFALERHRQPYGPNLTESSHLSSWPWSRNAATTAISERMYLGTASRIRFAGLQVAQPALDPIPRHAWPNPAAGSTRYPLKIQQRPLSSIAISSESGTGLAVRRGSSMAAITVPTVLETLPRGNGHQQRIFSSQTQRRSGARWCYYKAVSLRFCFCAASLAVVRL